MNMHTKQQFIPDLDFPCNKYKTKAGTISTKKVDLLPLFRLATPESKPNILLHQWCGKWGKQIGCRILRRWQGSTGAASDK
jgi:hypothetical protein